MKDRLMRAAVRGAMSASWLVRFAGRKRAAGIDAELDRQLAAALEFQRIAKLPDLDLMEPPAARIYSDTGPASLALEPEPMAEVIDTHVASIPVRIFVPHDAGRDWIVYFHGGGGVTGSIAGSEPAARYIAARSRCTVASVEYRLGPEHRHPAAVDDACVAWNAMVERVPAGGRIAVAGDSFGGFLAAYIDHLALLGEARQPDVQVLIYPVIDFSFVTPSVDRYAHGYLLTKAMMLWYRGHYLKPTDDPRAVSPWAWRDDLKGSAPAVIVTCGYDPLVDEGRAWAELLRAAGTEVVARDHASLIHGFLSLAGAIDAARAATDLICQDIVALLRR